MAETYSEIQQTYRKEVVVHVKRVDTVTKAIEEQRDQIGQYCEERLCRCFEVFQLANKAGDQKRTGLQVLAQKGVKGTCLSLSIELTLFALTHLYLVHFVCLRRLLPTTT